MHDIDRTKLETDFEVQDTEEFEFDSEVEPEMEFEDMEMESPLEEVEEMELAAELLQVTDEAELDQFLGKLFKKIGRGVGRFFRSPVFRGLGRVLKRVARTALPIAGRVLGGVFGGPAGAAVGGRLASTAGKIFGLELEGLSPEDQEFEVARRFVRLASTAARKAALAPPNIPATQVVNSAIAAAARRHAPGLAPGLLRGPLGAMMPAVGAIGRGGRWIRRGRRIILLGV